MSINFLPDRKALKKWKYRPKGGLFTDQNLDNVRVPEISETYKVEPLWECCLEILMPVPEENADSQRTYTRLIDCLLCDKNILTQPAEKEVRGDVVSKHIKVCDGSRDGFERLDLDILTAIGNLDGGEGINRYQLQNVKPAMKWNGKKSGKKIMREHNDQMLIGRVREFGIQVDVQDEVFPPPAPDPIVPPVAFIQPPPAFIQPPPAFVQPLPVPWWQIRPFVPAPAANGFPNFKSACKSFLFLIITYCFACFYQRALEVAAAFVWMISLQLSEILIDLVDLYLIPFFEILSITPSEKRNVIFAFIFSLRSYSLAIGIGSLTRSSIWMGRIAAAGIPFKKLNLLKLKLREPSSILRILLEHLGDSVQAGNVAKLANVYECMSLSHTPRASLNIMSNPLGLTLDVDILEPRLDVDDGHDE
ncbi:unnamed protein product [Orchesella dallaii]|uniref:Uncharacterized protein n=1 Tax=Orchesella dallaii TaxID=48710 RepID=A0ABP1SAC0_9HEXA